MNIKIEKVKDLNNEEILEFLVQENVKLFLTLHPEYQELYQEKYQKQIDDKFRKYFQEDFKKNPIVYAAYLEDEIVGCGFIENNGYFNSLFVREEYQNQGIGTQIFKKIMESCHDLDVITFHTRKELIPYFEKFSFHPVEYLSDRNSVKMELERGSYGK